MVAEMKKMKPKIKKILIGIISMLIVYQCYLYIPSRIINSIASYDCIEGETVSFAGYKPSVYKEFERLSRIASDEKLIELLNHSSNIVKCYSFWALSNRDNIKLYPILINNLHNSDKVCRYEGCSMYSMSVEGFFYSKTRPKLNTIEREKLDSIFFR